MANSVNQSLSRAYEHIESDRLNEARAILEPIIADNKDNIEAWWLYAHAVEDKEQAREALDNVLRLDPHYPEADELLQQLSAMRSSASTADSAAIGEAPFDLDELFDDDDEEDDDFDDRDDDFDRDETPEEDEIATPLSRRQVLLRLLITVIVIALILVIFVVINPFGEDETPASPTAPAVVSEGTSAVSQSVESTQTPPVATTEEAVAANETPSAFSSYASITTALSDLSVLEDRIAVTSTTLGDTLLVPVCGAPGSLGRDTLNSALFGLANIAENDAAFGDDVVAFGVELVDCDDDNLTLNIIAVSLSDAEAYAQGLLSDDAYRSRWRATN